MNSWRRMSVEFIVVAIAWLLFSFYLNYTDPDVQAIDSSVAEVSTDKAGEKSVVGKKHQRGQSIKGVRANGFQL